MNKNQKNNLPSYIWSKYIPECTGFVGNIAPNIKVNSKYAVKNIPTSYYTTFNIIK